MTSTVGFLRTRTAFVAVALGGAVFAAQPAAAAAIASLDLDGGCSVECGLDGSNGNVRTFTATASDGSLVRVRVTAWSIFDGNWNAGTHRESFLGHYGSGLGVTSPWITNGDSDGGSGRHTADNSGSKDYVVLQFDRMISPNEVTLNAFDMYSSLGWTKDNDATILIGTVGTDWNQFLDVSDAFPNIATDLHRIDIKTTPGSPNVGFDAAGKYGNVVIVGADLFWAAGGSDKPDSFKLASFGFYTEDTPEPAALGLFGLGLLGLGAARRRKG